MLEVTAEDPELQAVAPAVEMAPLASRAKGVGLESRLLDGYVVRMVASSLVALSARRASLDDERAGIRTQMPA